MTGRVLRLVKAQADAGVPQTEAQDAMTDEKINSITDPIAFARLNSPEWAEELQRRQAEITQVRESAQHNDKLMRFAVIGGPAA